MVSYDFDGTLHTEISEQGVGDPYNNILEQLRVDYDAGNKIVITTARTGFFGNGAIWDFLKEHGVDHMVSEIKNTAALWTNKAKAIKQTGAVAHYDDREIYLDEIAQALPGVELFKADRGHYTSYTSAAVVEDITAAAGDNADEDDTLDMAMLMMLG